MTRITTLSVIDATPAIAQDIRTIAQMADDAGANVTLTVMSAEDDRRAADEERRDFALRIQEEAIAFFRGAGRGLPEDFGLLALIIAGMER